MFIVSNKLINLIVLLLLISFIIMIPNIIRYVVLPQLIVTFLSSIFFTLVKFMEIQEDNFDSFGWVLRFGGIGAIISAFFISKINYNIKRM